MLIQQVIDTKYKVGQLYIVTTWKVLGIPVYIKTAKANIVPWIMSLIINQIEKARDEFDLKLSKLAHQYRNSTIDPLCKKYNLNFFSGMGTFFFSSDEFDIIIHDADEVDFDIEELKELHEDDLGPHEAFVLKYASAADDLQEVFDVLNAEIYDFLFGYYL